MPPKAAPSDFSGRFREIVSDPLNLLIRRHELAGVVKDGMVYLHNGHIVPASGPGSYYEGFSQILIVNRGVHEPVEEYAFQQILPHLPPAPLMIELGAYWGHYSMWLKQARADATTYLVEPDEANLEAGRANFERNGYEGIFIKDFVGHGHFGVDDFVARNTIKHIDILHCDIQGHELEMLADAGASLTNKVIDYLFVSTHSQKLHDDVCKTLSAHGYRIELSSGFDTQTTSFDGFVFAVAPALPVVFVSRKLIGRQDLTRTSPQDILFYLMSRHSGDQD